MVFDYVKYYEVYRVLFPEPKNLLSLGGGAYTIPQIFFNEVPNLQIDVVEIEPSLYDIAKTYFRLTDDELVGAADILNDLSGDCRKIRNGLVGA